MSQTCHFRSGIRFDRFHVDELAGLARVVSELSQLDAKLAGGSGQWSGA